MIAREGRTREIERGIHVEIPSDVEIPTCTRCGEESMTLDVSEPLDALLRARLGTIARIDETRAVLMGDGSEPPTRVPDRPWRWVKTHLLWVLDRAAEDVSRDPERAHRALGYVIGVMSCTGRFQPSELENFGLPEDES